MYEFDARKVKENLVEWIQDFFELNGKDCTGSGGHQRRQRQLSGGGFGVEALGKRTRFRRSAA